MPLSSANVVQAKTGSDPSAQTAAVTLDAGTQAGSTVTVEITAGGVPFTDGGLGGTVPTGFELDAVSVWLGVKYLYVFRKRNVAAGEGAAGGSPASWDFSFTAPGVGWAWRVTEWDTNLEPVSPLDAAVSNLASGASVSSVSTGTTVQNGRADTVSLAWHLGILGAGSAGTTLTFSAHTNSFTQRDQLRSAWGTTQYASCWSWNFNAAAGTFETTATVTNSAPNAGDGYPALLVVYAATTYA